MIHEYYKKQFTDFKVIVQINPETFAGIELTIFDTNKIEKRKMQFDNEIYEDLVADNFIKASPLEFNLYLKGITG